MGKLKQYMLTTKINDVEVNVVCLTSSLKKFSLLLDKSYNYVREYGNEMGYVVDECFESPHVLLVER